MDNMVKNSGKFTPFQSLDCREKAVFIVSSLFTLYRIYLYHHHELNGRNSLILGALTIFLPFCGKLDIPSSLTRNGSTGLLYGLVLLPGISLGISEQNSRTSILISQIANEQVGASMWITLFLYFPRLKVKWNFGCYMQSLAIFFLSGIFMQYVCCNLSTSLFLRVSFSLLLAKVTSSHLPHCFTCGELFLISDLITSLLINYRSLDSDIEVCLVGNFVLLFMLFYMVSMIPILMLRMMSTTLFYSFGTILFISLVSKLFDSLPQGLVMWTFEFFQSNWPYRMGLLMLWVAEILACVLYVALCRPLQKQSSTTERKIFHVVILITFLPGIYLDIPMIFICSVGAVCLLVLLEMMRALEIPPLANLLNERFSVFVDSQDRGHLILTPIYLLLGQCLPIWGACLQQPTLLYAKSPAMPPCAYSGILSVAVGDTAASVIGSKWGKVKWTGSQKTVEGTVAAVISQVVVAMILCNGLISMSQIAAIISIALIEAYTSQIDNLILPTYMYFLLNAVR